jgi:hypothetical protein
MLSLISLENCIRQVTLIFTLDLNRGILDINLRNCLIDKQNYHDELSRKQREKERDFRNLKKTELLLKVSLDALTQAQAMNQRLLLEVDMKTQHLHLFKLRALYESKSVVLLLSIEKKGQWGGNLKMCYPLRLLITL